MQKKGERIPWHPVRGYATEEQWRQLQELPLCPQRDYLIRQIEKQTSKKGKMS